MKVGDHIQITFDNRLGALSPDCWSVDEGRLTARLYFDSEVGFVKGDEGTIIEQHDVGEPGWFIVDIQGYAVPLHEGMMEVVE